MTREQMQAKVIELAAGQVGVDPSEVTPASHFVNDLNYDSLDAVDFTMKVEDEFRVTIPDDQVEKLQTVGAVIDLLAQQIPAEAA